MAMGEYVPHVRLYNVSPRSCKSSEPFPQERLEPSNIPKNTERAERLTG